MDKVRVAKNTSDEIDISFAHVLSAVVQVLLFRQDLFDLGQVVQIVPRNLRGQV